jgi:hypothetical protein
MAVLEELEETAKLMQQATYAITPLSPKQIQEFNNQPIAPAETPAGPVYLESPPVSQKPNASIDSHYIKNPDGEEQAEAQGAESSAPFEPIPTTFTF